VYYETSRTKLKRREIGCVEKIQDHFLSKRENKIQAIPYNIVERMHLTLSIKTNKLRIFKGSGKITDPRERRRQI